MNESVGLASPRASAQRPREKWFALGLGAVIALYGLGYLLWFLHTPLGRAPQLDSAENLNLAGQIANGTLAHEPFYRALLYPAVLALPLKLGLPASNLPAFAAMFGLCCHFLTTLGVAKLAKRVWVGRRENSAALLAAGLWGLNPVALFYAVDVLDTVPSLTLAIWAFVWWARPGLRLRDALGGGMLLGLAVAARPHFFPLVFIAPLARSWLSCRWKPQWPDALAWAGVAAVLLLLGGVQKYWSGEFAILPTQGAYNFYAANRPGANGKYYAQQIFFSNLAPGENPARKEAELLYAQAKLANSVPENVYWNQQSREVIAKDPGAWVKLLAKKAYYLFNDFDQYNNQTLAWHQAESPFLKWNYLGWGILLVLAAGIVGLRGHGQGTLIADFNCPVFAGTWLVFCAYAAGAMLYYASGRFRLPLAPLLCVLAGGWMTWPGWAVVQRSKVIAASLAMALAAFVTFSHFFDAHDESTFIQDELLSANAAAQTGEDGTALRYAEMALQRDPARPDARRIAVLSYFNLSTDGEPGYDQLDGWKRQLPRLQGIETMDESMALAAGSAYWKTGERDKAVMLWQAAAAKFGPQTAPAQALAVAESIRSNAPSDLPPSSLPLLAFLKKAASP